MNHKLRVLHTPYNFANNWWVLSRAERKLGIKSDLIVFDTHPFYSHSDQNLKIPGISIPNEIKRWLFFRRALENYDIFHFNFGHSILDYPYLNLNFLDFPILKKKGKKIFITFQGDDARQKDFYLKNYGQKDVFSPYTSSDKYLDYVKRCRIGKLEKYADFIFAFNPDTMHVLPPKTEFLPYAVEIPARGFLKKNSKGKIIIVHAPSDRRVKGTEVIIKAVNRVAKKYPIDFKIVENKTHEEALKIYRQADIAIDQIYLGWYGGFAVETMALAVPTIAYLRQSDLEKFIPFREEIPIVNADPNSLEKVLANLIEKPELREKIGNLSRKFVQKYHDPLKIAQKMENYYLKCLDQK